MIIKMDKANYWIEPLKLVLNGLALLALIASIWDGIPAIIVALLIFIIDELKHPFPIFAKVIEENEPPNDVDLDDDKNIKP